MTNGGAAAFAGAEPLLPLLGREAEATAASALHRQVV